MSDPITACSKAFSFFDNKICRPYIYQGHSTGFILPKIYQIILTEKKIAFRPVAVTPWFGIEYMFHSRRCNTMCDHQVFLIHHEALEPWSCVSVWGGPVSEEVSGHTYPFCKAVGSYVSVIPPCGTKGHLSSHREDQLQQARCTQHKHHTQTRYQVRQIWISLHVGYHSCWTCLSDSLNKL